jgi:putative spermidine/putrescine transport system permease protein
MLAAVIFLHFPFAIILLYCFTTDDRSYTFPPPGLTLQWFGVAWGRPDVWRALWLSVQVATVATTVALVLGMLASAAVYRSKFFGRDTATALTATAYSGNRRPLSR